MDNQASYFGILPAEVRYNKEITDFAKILYTEFMALSNRDGFCFATNKYFADLYGKDADTISRAVTQLRRCGFIKVDIIGKIYLTEIGKIPNGYSKKPMGGTVKSRRGDTGKDVHNNKVNNKDNKHIVTGKAGHDSKPPKEKKQPQPIVWPKYLKDMKENPNETIQVIALYFEEKKLKYETDTQAQAAIKRNLKASKRLIEAGWTPKQVFGAFSKAKADFKALWTLETIEKILLDHQS